MLPTTKHSLQLTLSVILLNSSYNQYKPQAKHTQKEDRTQQNAPLKNT